MAQSERIMTKQSVIAIMNKRTLVPETALGKKVRLTIQGNGNIIDVKDKDGNPVQSATEPGTVLRKQIFNVKANSGIAMSNARNRQTLKDAVAAEKAGDAQKASDLYNQYLNACQVSFGVLLPSAKAEKLSDGVEIAAAVEKITTDNGSLLTLDASTISIVEPEVYGKTSFSIEDAFGEEEEETASELEESLKGMDRKALIAYIKANNLSVGTKNKSDDEVRASIVAASQPVSVEETEI